MRDLFNADIPEIHIDKPIRLIELFGGYGSQSMALERIGADFEPYFLCEFDGPAVRSYNAVHGMDFKPLDIRDVHGEDLKICDADKYFYLLTYSFPCTDLSVAGKMAGMAKGSGTRSGLLWEVERILRELCESGAELPQCLFMENVPQVASGRNAGDFNSWREFLRELGYTNYLEILSAKDYGVAQSRKRAFMFSFLSDVYYEFPKPIPLEKRLVDYLEEDVDEKYYLKSENAKRMTDDLVERGELDCKKSRERLIPCKRDKVDGTGHFLPVDESGIMQVGCGVGSTITARHYKGANGDNMVIEANSGDNTQPLVIDGDTKADVDEAEKMSEKRFFDVYNKREIKSGVCITLTTHGNMSFRRCGTVAVAENERVIVAQRGRNPENPKARKGGLPTEQRLEVGPDRICNTLTTVQKDNMVLDKARYRIRRLTPRECGRLMGVKDSDIDRMAAVNSNSQLYKQFGNSIVVDVMCAMFRKLNIKGVS